ncbi:glutathione S-transferase-like protein, partial [Mycena filopes]
MLKLYGFRLSSCTRRVAVVCKELNVPYDLIKVDILKGEQRSAEHLARQQFGVVPAIEDDGFDLFENRAIARYIVAKYGAGSTLVPDPKDIVAAAKFEQAVSIENNNFDPTAGNLCLSSFSSRGFLKNPGMVRLLHWVVQAPKLDAYEHMLGKEKYLAGDTLTLADLFHLPWFSGLLDQAKLDLLGNRPNVARWWKEISAGPAWQAVKESA